MTNESPNVVGKRAEKIAQQSLWQRNYRVKDVSHVSGHDLLVDGVHRVEVKSMRGGSTSFLLESSKFDVLCVVVMGEFNTSVFYLKDKKDLPKLLEVGRKDRYFVDAKRIKEYFTRRPQEIFGKWTNGESVSKT